MFIRLIFYYFIVRFILLNCVLCRVFMRMCSLASLHCAISLCYINFLKPFVVINRNVFRWFNAYNVCFDLDAYFMKNLLQYQRMTCALNNSVSSAYQNTARLCTND